MEKRGEVAQAFFDSLPLIGGVMMFRMLDRMVQKIDEQERIQAWFEALDELA